MRLLLLMPLLSLAACDIQDDPASKTVTVTYNKQEIRERARKAGRVAKEVAVGVGNVTATTGRAVKREIGDIDVDVRRTRDPDQK